MRIRRPLDQSLTLQGLDGLGSRPWGLAQSSCARSRLTYGAPTVEHLQSAYGQGKEPPVVMLSSTTLRRSYPSDRYRSPDLYRGSPSDHARPSLLGLWLFSPGPGLVRYLSECYVDEVPQYELEEGTAWICGPSSS